MLTETELLDTIMSSYPVDRPGCVAFAAFHDKMLNDVYPAYLEMRTAERASAFTAQQPPPEVWIEPEVLDLEKDPLLIAISPKVWSVGPVNYTEPVPGTIHATTTEEFPLNGSHDGTF